MIRPKTKLRRCLILLIAAIAAVQTTATLSTRSRGINRIGRAGGIILIEVYGGRAAKGVAAIAANIARVAYRDAAIGATLAAQAFSGDGQSREGQGACDIVEYRIAARSGPTIAAWSAR